MTLRRGTPIHSLRHVLLTICLVAAAARDAGAVENGGPFGPEIARNPRTFTPAFSRECGPDTHGVTVRLVEIHDPSAPDGERYRNLVSRTDANGEAVEQPYPFADNPFTSFPWGVACDGEGGFVVVWTEYVDPNVEPCLRVRAFEPTGTPSTGEELLWPGCTQREEEVLQLDHVDRRYRVLWQSRKYSARRYQIVYRTLDEDALGSHDAVVLKRLPVRDNHPWYGHAARIDGDETALVVWKKSFPVKGQLIGLDGEPDSDVFRISLSHEGPAALEPIEDPGDGTLIPRWNSFWQAGPSGRRVAVSLPIPEPSTTTTTLPNDADVPVFAPASTLQRRRDKMGPLGAYPPTLAANSQGNAIAVWTGRDSERRPTVFFARFRAAAARWGKHHELPQDKVGMFSYRPRVVSLGHDAFLAMWIQASATGCSLVTTRSDDAGTTWSLPVVATQYTVTEDPSTCWISDFDLSADPDGALVAAWPDRSASGENSDPVLRISRSLDRGETWSPPFTALTLEDEAWRGFSLAPGGNGKWGIVWSTNFIVGNYDHTDTGGQVFFSASTDSGESWSAPKVVAGEPGMSPGQPQYFGPMIASDRSGTWMVAWASGDSLTGPAADWDVFASRSTDTGASWTAAMSVAPYAASDIAADFAPSLATDAQGRWMIAWETSETVPGASGLDFDIVVASSDDAGESWTTPVAVDRNADSDEQGDSEVGLASGGPGKWVAAWTDRTDVPDKLGIGVRGAALP